MQAVVNTVMNLRAESFLPSLATAAFSGRPGGGGGGDVWNWCCKILTWSVRGDVLRFVIK